MKISLPRLFSRAFILLSITTISASAQYSQVDFRTNFGLITEVVETKPLATRPRRVLTEKRASLPPVVNSVLAPTELEKQAFTLLNEQRKENNLPVLEWNEEIAKVARLHSENMAKYKFFSHVGVDGSSVNDRADAFGISRWQAIGENIAYNRGYPKPAEFVVECWMKSPGHRGNILNNRWKESAVGVALAPDGSVYFTQVFLLRN